MDRTISWPPEAAVQDPRDRALRDMSAAIALVVAGVAVTMTLCCLEGAESAAFSGAAWAQAAGVAFRLRRESPASVTVVIGPRLLQPFAQTGSETES